MDNHRDEDPMSGMRLQALAAAKDARLKMERKEEDKLWARISSPLPLSDALAGLTKYDLNQIRINLGIKNASALRKDALAAELCKHIPALSIRFLRTADHHRFRLVDKLVKSGGRIPAPQLEREQLYYFLRRGVMFSGTADGARVLVMPQEVVRALQAADLSIHEATAKRNTEWIRLSQGLLYYYGAMTFDRLVSFLVKYTGDNVPEWEFFDVFMDAAEYYGTLRMGIEGVSYARVWDPAKVRQEQEARLGLPYYPFAKEQLIKAGKPGFVDRYPEYVAFANFIFDHFEVSREMADQFAEECVIAHNNGETLTDIMDYAFKWLEFDSEDTVQTMLALLVNMLNNARQWFLKGHTPKEIAPQKTGKVVKRPNTKADVIDIRTRQKIGRNDPCPCGSGKKFKKCCMVKS